jgi:hypothetical protein
LVDEGRGPSAGALFQEVAIEDSAGRRLVPGDDARAIRHGRFDGEAEVSGERWGLHPDVDEGAVPPVNESRERRASFGPGSRRFEVRPGDTHG